MLDRVRPFIKRLLYYGGYYHPWVRRLRGPSEKRLLILMYHDLLPDGSDTADRQTPTRSEFAAHLREINRHYRLVSLRQAVREIRDEGGLRRDSVAITFDDGYPSIYTIAYPLLREHAASATVYLLTGWIDQEMVFWWQSLRDIVAHSTFDGVTAPQLIDTAGFPLPSLADGLEHPGFRSSLVAELERELVGRPDVERDRTLDRLRALLLPAMDYTPRPKPALTWDQIRLMADNGIEFEAHTRSHVNLRYTDRLEAEREITESKQEIENRLQREVVGFAYPYGKDLEVYQSFESILAKHGFTHAVNAVTGCNSNRSDLYALRRGSLPLSTSRAIIGRYLAVLFQSP